MNEAVRKPVQDRYEAVQADRTYSQPQRRPGDRAMLVNNRSTVFDRPRADLAPVDPIDEIRDPIWDHAQGTRWTPDLVHCRLIVVGEVIERLPGYLRKGYVSIMGNIAVTEASPPRRAPPTPAEISIADWTWSELLKRTRRSAILQASACGISAEKIAEALKARGLDRGKSTVHRWYMAERRVLAAQWQARHIPVDAATFARWEIIFGKGQK